MFRWLKLLIPMALAGCGSKAVDLDEAVLVDSADPTVVGTVREQVTQLAVDAERLYWLAGNIGTPQSEFGSWALRSCVKQDCAATLLTHDKQDAHGGSAFGLRGGEIFWFRFQEGSIALVACPVAGGAMRTVAQAHSISAAAFDDDHAYYTSGNQAYAVSLSETDSAEAPRVFATPDPLEYIWRISAGGGYLYWLAGGSSSYGPRAAAASLQRIRSDGSSPLETLAAGVETTSGGGLTIDATHTYWAEDVLAGSIHRCPKAGCTGGSEVVVASVRSPTGLLLAGQQLYFQHEIDAYQYGISSCTLGQCDSPTLLAQGLEATAAMAVDDQYMYVATTDQDLQPQFAEQAPVAQIRRFPR